MSETMTPALKAMVEAMERALDEQAVYVSPGLDLERVARAGLEAIREPGEAMVEAGAQRDDGADITNAIGVYRAMIDAIFTPTTGEGNG